VIRRDAAARERGKDMVPAGYVVARRGDHSPSFPDVARGAAKRPHRGLIRATCSMAEIVDRLSTKLSPQFNDIVELRRHTVFDERFRVEAPAHLVRFRGGQCWLFSIAAGRP
jgi:hypothetical protein